jgi:hypothetical protein
MASQYKDQAHRRLVQYYRHLLPELFQELDAGLAPSKSVENITRYLLNNMTELNLR